MKLQLHKEGAQEHRYSLFYSFKMDQYNPGQPSIAYGDENQQVLTSLAAVVPVSKQTENPAAIGTPQLQGSNVTNSDVTAATAGVLRKSSILRVSKLALPS